MNTRYVLWEYRSRLWVSGFGRHGEPFFTCDYVKAHMFDSKLSVVNTWKSLGKEKFQIQTLQLSRSDLNDDE